MANSHVQGLSLRTRVHVMNPVRIKSGIDKMAGRHEERANRVLSLFRIYRPVNWEFFRIYPPDFQGH